MGAAGYDISVILLILDSVVGVSNSIIAFSFSLIIATPFLISMLVLDHTVSEEKKFWTNTAVVFSVIYTTYVTMNYVVQLTTVIPALQQGTIEILQVLNQTPHSLFWDLDGLGYIFMGFATLFASQAFEKTGFEKWLRWFSLPTVWSCHCLQ